ncbi:MAG: hypothetical protein J5519_05395, partial [Bacteroidales bacterium]|nr:hypothetical protein [Bacteroidales bacterium]
MKKIICLISIALVSFAVSCGSTNRQGQAAQTENNITAPAAPKATVYFTSDISPEGLVAIYKALGVPATGRV